MHRSNAYPMSFVLRDLCHLQVWDPVKVLEQSLLQMLPTRLHVEVSGVLTNIASMGVTCVFWFR